MFASLLAILAFFLDPYSRENKAEFARCDHACCGEEHKASPGNPARPSYCTQPIFHAPAQQSAQTTGYVSSDGHTFLCANPAVSNHAYVTILQTPTPDLLTSYSTAITCALLPYLQLVGTNGLLLIAFL